MYFEIYEISMIDRVLIMSEKLTLLVQFEAKEKGTTKERRGAFRAGGVCVIVRCNDSGETT